MRYHIEIDEEQQEEITAAQLEESFFCMAQGVVKPDSFAGLWWGEKACESMVCHLYACIDWFTDPDQWAGFRERLFKMPVE